MKDVLVKQYTHSEFRALLSKFQDAIDRREYTEKIPYDAWRKLMKATGTIHIELFKNIINIHIWPDSEVLYSDKIYNWGFGRFFWDTVIKKERNEDMTLNSANSATFTCEKADINRSVWDQLMSTSAIQYINTDADAAKLETKADYMSCYDSDSATSCPNYGTTTNHTIKINGDPLFSNSIYMTKDDYNGIWGDTGTTVTNISTIGDRVDTLESQMKQLMSKKEKENDNMKGFNFDFGPCTNDNVRMSMYGVAVKNAAGTYVSYNPKTKEIVDVDILNFDGAKYMYKVPVALSQVAIGDIVIHNRKPMFVVDADLPGKNLTVVDVCAGEQKTVIPTQSPFGFNFITKIVNLFDSMMIPNANNPFGSMWMLAFMSDDKSFDMKDMMMLSMMSGNDFGSMNPMMLMLMADNKGDKSDWLMPLMLMNGSLMGQTHTCKCEKTPADAGQI